MGGTCKTVPCAHTREQETNAGRFSGKAEGNGEGGNGGARGRSAECESCCPGRSKARQGPSEHRARPSVRETRGLPGCPRQLGTLPRGALVSRSRHESESGEATPGLTGLSRDFQFATRLGKGGKQKGSFVTGSLQPLGRMVRAAVPSVGGTGQVRRRREGGCRVRQGRGGSGKH